MRVIKEKVFQRLKAYNVTQAVHFLCTRTEDYYVRRLVDVANNRMCNPSQSKYHAGDGDVNFNNIVKVNKMIKRMRSFNLVIVIKLEKNKR